MISVIKINTSWNFGKFPMLEIINFLNFNEKIIMLNFNKTLRNEILKYHKAKVLKYYLIKWKEMNAAFNNAKFFSELNRKEKLKIFSIFEKSISSLDDITDNCLNAEEKAELEDLLFLKFINHFEVLSDHLLCLCNFHFSEKMIKIITNYIHYSSYYDNLYTIRRDESKKITISTKAKKSLKWIDLIKNEIGNEGLISLADAFKVNSSLHTIHLNNNKIGDRGATALADSLKINTSLIEISLMYNNIGDIGTKNIAEALKNNSSVERIHLNGNKLEDEGAIAIADLLKVNSTIKEISLWLNNIGDEGANYIAEVVDHRKENLIIN